MVRCTLVTFGVFVSVAAADPIPKASEAEATRRQWGILVDNGGGTTLKKEGSRLRMFLPAGDRLVYPMRGDTPAFAPYIAESYRGDFVATVTVHRHSAPADATGFATDPLTGSGLIAVFDDKTILSFSRVSMPQKGDLSFRSTFRYPSGSNTAMGGSPRNKTKNESTTLRLIRSGEQLNMDYSFDSGKTWQRFTNFQRPTSDEVKVGIYAEHSCDAVTEASFEGFSIKKYVEEKKP